MRAASFIGASGGSEGQRDVFRVARGGEDRGNGGLDTTQSSEITYYDPFPCKNMTHHPVNIQYPVG